MKVHEVMSVDVEAATEDASVAEVVTRIVWGIFNGMPVIGSDGRLMVQVTTIDILKAIQKKIDLNKLCAKKLMTPNPITVHGDTDADDAIDQMKKYWVMMVPVIEEDGRLGGVCSRSDVLKEILNQKFVSLGRKRTLTVALG